MSLQIAKSKLGKVTTIRSLIEEMENIQQRHIEQQGEMHYSICWKNLVNTLRKAEKENE